MTKIYTAYLMGRLGNQMFQISHAISQSLKHNTDTIFNINSPSLYYHGHPHKYLNNIFRNIKFSEINTEFYRVVEKDWNNPNLFFNPNQNIEFYGYFQSEKNFFGFGEYIKNLFLPTDSFKTKINTKYPNFYSQKKISMHVRRGDYLDLTDVHPVLPISYYEKCLSKLENYDVIYVFSDDKKWVSENFSDKKFVVVKDLDDYEELWMMSLCDHNIISNSSFSWWGNYLNSNPDKITFAPSIWFGKGGPNPHDSIYNIDWKIIDI